MSTEPTLVFVLKLVLWGACICGILGLYARASATIALLTGLYVMGIPQLYGKVNHYHHLLLWFAALLVPSRCADVLSLDAVRTAGGRPRPSTPEPDRAYALPIRYTWLLLGVLYFFPGFWKFVSEEMAWAFSENLKFYMRIHWFTKTHIPFFRVDQYPVLYQAGGLLTLLFELGFVFALPFRSARSWAAGTAFLFHQSTRLFLSIAFWTLYPVLLFLIDVRTHLVRLGRRLYPSRLSVTYDPDEAWQRRVVGALLRLDLLDRLRVAEAGTGAEERADQTGGERAASLAVAASGPDRDALSRDGRFQVTAGLRLAGHVPPVLLLLLLAPFARSWLRSAPSSTGAGGTGIRALHLVGAFLVAVNVVFGLAKIKSYPFSVYPTFAVRADSTVTTLRVTGRTAGGEEVDVFRGVRNHKLAGLAPARIRGLFRSIFRVDDPAERTRKLRGFFGGSGTTCAP